MGIEVRLDVTKDVRIYGIDKRKVEDLVWCAITAGVTRLFWIDGYLICAEVYEKAFEFEVKERFFPISQVCYARFPEYRQKYEVPGASIPIVDVSDMAIYKAILKVIKEHERGQK